MAYRTVVSGDKVKITDRGRAHGCLGTVLCGGYWGGVRVMYTYGGKDVIGEFKQEDLVLARNTPTKVTISIQKPKQNTTLTKEIKMSTFKIGDKVRVTGSRLFASYVMGFEGEIYKIEDTVVYVRFADGDTDYGYASEIELINVPVEAHKTLADKLDALDALTAEIRAMVGL